MGNGVGTELNHSNLNSEYHTKEYLRLEKLCRQGYFYQNQSEYLEALTVSIQTNTLDCLELLIPSGNIKSVMPIHLAAKIGKLEPVDLLISAGFPGDIVDKQGRTPLHHCAFSHSLEIGLVVSLLSLSFPKSVKKYDFDGYTPIHFAVVQDNVAVLEALMKAHGNSNKETNNLPLTQSGKSVLQLCKEKNSIMAEQYFKGLNNKENSIRANKPGLKRQVSSERIMQIWERFFENAFQGAGLKGEEDNDPDLFNRSNQEYKDHFYTDFDDLHISAKKQTKEKPKKAALQEVKVTVSPPAKSFKKDDWFDWIICCDEVGNDNKDYYYVLNIHNQERRWLGDHINFLRKKAKKQYYFLFDNYDNILYWPYPTSISECINYGWLTYYDSIENTCWWMNAVTHVFEYYLPLGSSKLETPNSLAVYNLSLSSDHPDWCQADQSPSTSWLMVLYDDGYDNNYYYLNTVTNQTIWTAPNGWTLWVQENWNGWMPCCMEDNVSATFWYNEATGESAWS